MKPQIQIIVYTQIGAL